MSEEGEIIGSSYYDLVRKTKTYAVEGSPVLFEGPTGVGKELFARLYARQIQREITPVHFGALSDGTIESQLFGHKRGSFTGADSDEVGLIKSAKGKVLFFDEIGLASVPVQGSLLRIIEYGDYRPVGETQTAKATDVRFVAATNRPNSVIPELRQRFRILRIHPPRDSDILSLFEHYFSKFPRIRYITERALLRLYFYPWPGNIREIKAVINQAVANRSATCIGSPDTVQADHLPERLLDVNFSELGRNYESENTVPIQDITDWIWTRFPFAIDYHRGQIVVDESALKQLEDEPPRQTVVEKAQKAIEENPLDLMCELPRAKAIKEFEKRYYLANAANPRVRSQKALAEKMDMNQSYLNRRLKMLGIQDEIWKLLKGSK